MGLFNKAKAWKFNFKGHEVIIANTLTDFKMFVDGERVEEGKGKSIITYNSAKLSLEGETVIISLAASFLGDISDLVVTGDIIELQSDESNREFIAKEICGCTLRMTEKLSGRRIYLNDELIHINTALSEDNVTPIMLWIDNKPVFLVPFVKDKEKLGMIAKTAYVAVVNGYGINTICGKYDEKEKKFTEG